MSETVTSGRVRAVDWSDIRRRLAAAEAALARGGAPDTETARAVLSERARELARAPRARERAAPLQLLAFDLGGERHGVETRFVRAVFPLAAETPLPGVSAPVTGVTVWRGELLVLLRFRPAAPPAGRAAAWVVVLGDERPEFGVLVDERPELELVDRAALHPAPDGSSWGQGVVVGTTPDALLVLDGATLIRTYP